MTRSAVASARVSSPVVRPSRSTTTRSAMPSTSGNSEEIISTASPSGGQPVHQRVDLRPRADVHPARRLVEDQQAPRLQQVSREEHLLLVAAGERRGGLLEPLRAHVEFAGFVRCGGLLLRDPQEAAVHELTKERHGDVRIGCHQREDPAGLAIFGDVGEPPSDGLGRRAETRRLAVDPHLPRGLQRAGNRQRGGRAARADETGETDDLPFANRERHVVKPRRAREPAHLEHQAPGHRRPQRETPPTRRARPSSESAARAPVPFLPPSSRAGRRAGR